jgi:hypothetical protein
MPVTVNVGEISTTNNDEIRTRGCDPCVGLIAIYNNQKVCAHFSVGYAGPYTDANIGQRINPVLQLHFPVAGLVAVGYTWGGGAAAMGSAQIINCLNAHFAGHAPVVNQTRDSITSNGNAIEFLNLQTWDYTNVPAANTNAELN